MIEFDSYVKGILNQVMDSYRILENLNDKPGDLDIIMIQLSKIIGLLNALIRKLNSTTSTSDEIVELSSKVAYYLENYDFSREIEQLSKLYQGDSHRIKNLRSAMLASFNDKRFIEKIEFLSNDL